jgi:hypothetical protein
MKRNRRSRRPRNCERDIMKKIAIRIMTVGGGLIATLVAGGAWTRH